MLLKLIFNLKGTVQTAIQCMDLKFFQFNGDFHSKNLRNAVFYLFNLLAITSFIGTFLFLKSFGSSWILADPKKLIDGMVNLFPEDLEVTWSINPATGPELSTNYNEPYSILVPTSVFGPLLGWLDDVEDETAYHVVHLVIGSTHEQVTQVLAGEIKEREGLRKVDNGMLPPVLVFASDSWYIHNLLIGDLDDIEVNANPPQKNYLRLLYSEEEMLLIPALKTFCQHKRNQEGDDYICSQQILEKRAPTLKANPIFTLSDFKLHSLFMFQILWAVQMILRSVFSAFYLLGFHWLLTLVLISLHISSEMLSRKKTALVAIYCFTPSLVLSTAFGAFFPSDTILVVLFILHASYTLMACKLVVAAPLFRMVNAQLNQAAIAGQQQPEPPNPQPSEEVNLPPETGHTEENQEQQRPTESEEFSMHKLLVSHISPTSLALSWQILHNESKQNTTSNYDSMEYSAKLYVQSSSRGAYLLFGCIPSTSQQDDDTSDYSYKSTVSVYDLLPGISYRFRVEIWKKGSQRGKVLMKSMESDMILTPMPCS
mmetsp:Transcript_2273/g.3158  ORF Transcript_2273/g.3158 Transcript_2273/m.3158 type:complete len:541 (+) Transcript_2273:93-1715(+)